MLVLPQKWEQGVVFLCSTFKAKASACGAAGTLISKFELFEIFLRKLVFWANSSSVLIRQRVAYSSRSVFGSASKVKTIALLNFETSPTVNFVLM